MTTGITTENVGGRCFRCGERKAAADFYADKTKASGRKSICKACDLAKARDYYAAHAEVRAERWAAQAKQRLCARCGMPAASQRHRYCVRCGEAARRARRKRAKPSARVRALAAADRAQDRRAA